MSYCNYNSLGVIKSRTGKLKFCCPPPSSGTPSSVAWGTITGTLSNQTDLQSALNSKVTGSGTPNTLTKWNALGNGIQDSNITDNGSLITIASETNHTGKAVFRNGIVLSNNPGGVVVDNTSMVIGAGNNDVVSGSDHSLAVGSGNQILSDSDSSISVGQGNIMTEGTACAIFGIKNTITGTSGIGERCLVAGFDNSLNNVRSGIVLGGNNRFTSAGGSGVILGISNEVLGNKFGDSSYILGNNVSINPDSISGDIQNAFGIGTTLNLENGQMVLGYRNDKLSYPGVDYNNGLGRTKFVVSVGTGSGVDSSNNALIITERSDDPSLGGTTPQVPRIVMPTIVDFNFASDLDASGGGIPIGGLYHNSGALRIRLT